MVPLKIIHSYGQFSHVKLSMFSVGGILYAYALFKVATVYSKLFWAYSI